MHNPLAAFIYDTDNINEVAFESQRAGETVRLLLRRHIITNFWWIIFTILLFIPAFALFLYQNELLAQIESNILPSLFSPTELSLIAVIYSLGVCYYATINFLKWYFNVLIVSDTRIIDVNFSAPFNWQITQAQLEEVQDVRHTQGGIWGIIFNYGNLYVQTAGTSQNIAIRRIPKPGRVHEVIIQLLP